MCCSLCPLHPPLLCHSLRLAAGSCRGGTGTRRSPAGCGIQRHTAEEPAGTHLHLVGERDGDLQLDGETEAGAGQGSDRGPVPKVVSPETPARTQARPASTQRVVARRAGTAIGPCSVLAELVVAAGVGTLGTFVDIWGAERGWGDGEVAPRSRCPSPSSCPPREGSVPTQYCCPGPSMNPSGHWSPSAPGNQAEMMRWDTSLQGCGLCTLKATQDRQGIPASPSPSLGIPLLPASSEARSWKLSSSEAGL